MSPRSFRSLASVSLWVLALSACGQVVTSETAGDASGDSADAVSNLAPTVAIGSPLPGQIINKDEKLQLAAQVSDDRDLAETLTVRWYSDHQTEPLFDGKAGSDGKVALEVGPLPLGVRTLTVQAIDSAGLETKVDVKVFVNTAPGAPTIAIEPVKPTSIDDLQAKIVTPAVDPDRAASELTYSYKWLRNDLPTDVTTATVPADLTAKGDVWSVEVQAHDPAAFGPAGKAVVTIGNAPPSAVQLAIDPSPVDLMSAVTCTMVEPPVDADGDPIAYEWGWKINGYVNPAATSQEAKVSQLVGSDQGKSVAAGDLLQCFVSVKDADSPGAVALSAEVTILAFDVCGSDLNPCDLAASCSNTDTLEVECICDSGFTGDGKFCMDVDECVLEPCGPGAICTNSDGGFGCACAQGYQGDPPLCGNVDECTTGTSGCSTNADCFDTEGGFDCVCKAGFTGDGKACDDFDECAQEQVPCSPNANCLNSPGSYACKCKPGFVGDGKSCGDVNECSQNNGGCSALASCTNTQGSFECACLPGYAGDGVTCKDVDECQTGLGTCGGVGQCVNTEGSWKCLCDYPYKVGTDGQSCVKSDLCAFANACSPYASCKMLGETKVCTCKPGFQGDGLTCGDANECADGSSGCSPDAACANTFGSFTCTCKDGFQGDGITCDDIDECMTGAAGCGKFATCTNTPGAFQCQCNTGYFGDGKTCVEIDECANGTAGCAKEATCTNTPGSFLCQCKAGYEGDGKTCTDINECPQPWTWNFTTQGTKGWALDPVGANNVGWKQSGQYLYYGNGTNYDTPGTGNQGTATGPVFTFSKDTLHKISYDLSLQTQEPLPYEYLEVYLVLGPQQVLLAKYGSPMTTFVRQTVEVTGYAGKQAQLRFLFRTIDGYGNNGKGAFVGNIEILGSGGTCSTQATCTNLPGTYTCACNKPWLGDGKACYLLGMKELPGKSCLEILQSRGSMAAGLYSLNFTGVAADYWCEADGWTRLSSDTFEVNAGAWQPPVVTSCGTYGKILGGYGFAGGGVSLFELFKVLPAHAQVRVNGTYIALDSWDMEVGYVLVNGQQIWAQPFNYISTNQQCGVSWGEQAVTFTASVPHTAGNVEIRFGSNLNEAPTNESFAVDNINVWVR